MTEQPAGIGDLSSNAVGSGARFNAGKTPLHLTPLRLIADQYKTQTQYVRQRPYVQALELLGLWQEGGTALMLQEAVALLGPTREVMEATTWVFDYGRKKYAEWNWAKGMPWSVPMACAARHLIDLIEGKIEDHESHLPLVGHVGCNLVMLQTYHRTYAEGDDRPPQLRTP